MTKKVILLFVGLIALMQMIDANNLQWMRYPAISPDGSKIVFSFQGDLYLVNSNGGKAFQLTTNEAYDYKPVWSPDGSKIAFASDRFGNFDVFLIDANGGIPKRLTYYSGDEVPESFTPNGGQVVFSAVIMDDFQSGNFPRGSFPELYEVSVNGGMEKMILTTPAIEAKYSQDGQKILYQDQMGLEDHWRKHHTSSTTRDLWIYNVASNKHQKLTAFEGEDLYPVFSNDEKSIYYLSELNGNANLHKLDLLSGSVPQQLTSFETFPLRFLSIAKNGTLCFGYQGDIYTFNEGGNPIKVDINVINDNYTPMEYLSLSSGGSDISVSSNGKEVAFIIRGEVFVTSIDYNTTKRITNTPEQERSVEFSPDGKALVYASERNGSWNIYQTKLSREGENTFYNSTLLSEEVIIATEKEEFQPRWSPDGKEVAYLENRTTLKVVNIETKQSRTILDGKYNYSYSDGDQWFDWSPDGKWLLMNYFGQKRWSNEIGLVDAQGNQNITNLTETGYEEYVPKWMMGGKMIVWLSDREGFKRQGDFGGLMDIYGLFLTKESYDKYKLSEEEYKLLQEKEKEKDSTKKGDDKNKKDKIEPIEIDLNNIDARKVKLTLHSSDLNDFVLSPDGEELYYLSKFEDGYDLWVHKLRKDETTKLMKLNGNGGAMQLDKEGKNLFLMSGNQIIKIELKSKEKKVINYTAEFYLDREKEREYMFEHVWRQVREKFYDVNLHNVPWDFYKEEYKKFLPSISNNYDFAELLSEMLGELNASHTGSGYRPSGNVTDDKTARLGLYFDNSYTGKGLKVAEVLENSPLDTYKSKVVKGVIIEKLDGVALSPEINYHQLLNHKTGKNVLLSFYDEASKQRWEEVVKPISIGQESQLVYKRWTKRNEEMVDKLSNGRIGYVHIRGMDGSSYRDIFSKILGKNNDKEALILDTRNNGGGNLDEVLTMFLTGEKFFEYVPRGQYVGMDPMNRWTKPSLIVMNEANYSDSHCIPSIFTALEIGKTVGTPVPGTCTSVWWETLQDRSLYFGIPEVGIKDIHGDILENKQLYPDYEVDNDFDKISIGIDQQLEKSVEVMLNQLNSK